MHTVRWGSVSVLLLCSGLFSLVAGWLLPLSWREYWHGCLFLPVSLLSLWGMFRWLRLLFPRQQQGPLAATASLFLTPPMLILPWIDNGWPALQLLPVSLGCLISFKIWLRDGMKSPSLILWGLILVAGTLASPYFFIILPWIVLPWWKANPKRSSAVLGTLTILALTFIFSRISPIASTGTTANLPSPIDVRYLWERIPWWIEDKILLIAFFLWLLLFLTVIAYAGKSLFSSESWHLAPAIGTLAAATCALISIGILLSEVFLLTPNPPPVFVWLSLLPGMHVILALGWINLTDHWRSHRSMPNLPAEQPGVVVYGISVLTLLAFLWAH